MKSFLLVLKLLHGIFANQFVIKSVSLVIFCILATAASVEAKSKWLPKLESKNSLQWVQYLEPLDSSVNQSLYQLRSNWVLTAKPSTQFRYRLRPELQWDPSNKSTREVFFFDAPEAWLEWRALPLIVQAGLNTFSWGNTDVFNPLDVINSRRFYDPLNAEKKGAPSLYAKLDQGSWVLDAVYIPYQVASDLPGEKSRWLPRDVQVSRAATPVKIILPSALEYSELSRREYDNPFSHNYAARLQFVASSWDASFVYVEGASNAPSITPELTANAVNLSQEIIIAVDPQVGLRPIYYRKKTVGGTLTGTLGEWIVKAAYAYSAPQNFRSDVAGWTNAWVSTLETNWNLGSQVLTTLFQYSYSLHSDNSDNNVTSLDRIFDRSYLLGVRLTLPQETTFSSAILYDGFSGGSYAQIKFEKKLRDALTAELSTDLFDGPSGTPLGTYRKNDRTHLKATYFW